VPSTQRWCPCGVIGGKREKEYGHQRLIVASLSSRERLRPLTQREILLATDPTARCVSEGERTVKGAAQARCLSTIHYPPHKM
jgi:hypothetical protein